MAKRLLPPGCYLISLVPSVPSEAVALDGTLRLQRGSKRSIASGDLYARSGPQPVPDRQIPIFPLSQYRFYLKGGYVPKEYATETGFEMEFELHQFQRRAPGNNPPFLWAPPRFCRAQVTLTTPPAGEAYPVAPGQSTPVYFTGTVFDVSGTVFGRLTLGWISPYFRRAALNVARVAYLEKENTALVAAPLDDGSGTGWQEVFDQVRWQIEVVQEPTPISEPSGEEWSIAELYAKLLELRAASSSETDWCYHLLCVRQIDPEGAAARFGVMFDPYASDLNEFPREAAAVAAHEHFLGDAHWGEARNQRCDTQPRAFFRTGLHEIAHAMGLYHNSAGRYIMRPSQAVAEAGGEPFPKNALLSFSPTDARRLRHRPDIWVRPGGVPFDAQLAPYSAAPQAEDSAGGPGLKLTAFPLLKEVPFGAPVRVNFRLVNVSDRPQPIPASLSLKSGHASGWVIGPDGIARGFRSLVILEDAGAEVRLLPPAKSTVQSMTLIRGTHGPLFPFPESEYRVVIEVAWEKNESRRVYRASTTVRIADVPVPSRHAAARLQAEPNTLLSVAIGGDAFRAAIEPGLQDHVLRPHYVMTEAKRLGQRYFNRPPDWTTACNLLLENPVLSGSEIERIAKLVCRAGDAAQTPLVRKLVDLLKKKAAELGDGIDDTARELIGSL